MLTDLLRKMGFVAPGVEADKPAVGVSACLMGKAVRHDGGHRRHTRVHDELAILVRIVEACPEVGIGLPVPRAPIQVVRLDGAPRVRGVMQPQYDFTDALTAEADRLDEPLDGFVFKSRSPSCGLGTTPVHDAAGVPRELGNGAFAEALARRHPGLPMANETDLDGARFADAFVLRVFCHHYWRRGGDLDALRQRAARLDQPLRSDMRRFLDRLTVTAPPPTAR